QPVALLYPGHRTRKAAKAILISCQIVLSVSSSIGPFLPGIVNTLFPSCGSVQDLESTLGTLAGSQCSGTRDRNSSLGTSGDAIPPGVNANTLPDLALPKETVSGAGNVGLTGVVVISSQNLTIYGPGLMLNMVGGPQ